MKQNNSDKKLISRFERYDYDGKRLRRGNHYKGYVYNDSLELEEAEISILVDVHNLNLERILPSIKKLKLKICNPANKYDLNDLTFLSSLEELHISGTWSTKLMLFNCNKL